MIERTGGVTSNGLARSDEEPTRYFLIYCEALAAARASSAEMRAVGEGQHAARFDLVARCYRLGAIEQGRRYQREIGGDEGCRALLAALGLAIVPIPQGGAT